MRRPALVLLVLPLLLGSCTGDDDPVAEPSTSPSPTSTCVFGGPTISVECVDSGPQQTGASFPDDASKIAPVTLPEVKGRLGGAHNRDDPSLRTATFTVTVPQGSRIGSEVMCLGNGSVTLDTVPKSDAFQKITCNSDPQVPSELLVEDPNPVPQTTTFTVTVTADKASRWDVAVFATTAPPGESQS